MSVTVQAKLPGFFSAFMSLLLAIVLGVLWIFWAISDWASNTNVFIALILHLMGIFCWIYAFFAPIFNSGDIADRVPAIKAYNLKAPEGSKIEIRHPKRTAIVILTILGFFTFGILWFFALYMSSGPVNVDVPDDVAKAVGLKGTATNQASELLALKQLLDSGVISREQFEEQKMKLGFGSE
jgi:hypothetical protein